MSKRKSGRPTLASSGRTSVYVHAPTAEVAGWKRAAKRADMTLNGWLVALARAAVEQREKAAASGGCRASRGDGECSWSGCPQLEQYLPHCPFDICTCDDHDGFDHGCPLHGRVAKRGDAEGDATLSAFDRPRKRADRTP